MAGASRSTHAAGAAANPLIDVVALAAEVAGGEPPVLLDVRWLLGGPPGIDSYRAGHLPGAVFADLDADLAGLPGAGGRHPLPAAADAAARAWWTLRYFGHARVQVLDGGFRAWTAAGLPVTTDKRRLAAGDFSAVPGHLAVLDAAGAAALARCGVLLDARAGERYRGETEPIDPVAGHIPGALSAPTTANMADDGRFLPPAELRRRFAELGVARGPPPGSPDRRGPAPAVGAHCGSR